MLDSATSRAFFLIGCGALLVSIPIIRCIWTRGWSYFSREFIDFTREMSSLTLHAWQSRHQIYRIITFGAVGFCLGRQFTYTDFDAWPIWALVYIGLPFAMLWYLGFSSELMATERLAERVKSRKTVSLSWRLHSSVAAISVGVLFGSV